jgi:uncharacterized protein (TIGR03067 family)
MRTTHSRWLLILSLLFPLFTLSCSGKGTSDTEPLIKNDAAQLQGTWQVVSAKVGVNRDVVPLPDEVANRLQLLFSSDKLVLREGLSDKTATFHIDPDQNPRTLDMVHTDGPEKGKTFLAVYQLDGDNLQLCRANPGDQRPASFTPANGQMLFVLKRVSGAP